MNNQIFRKTSLEKLSSPEQLDQMITVTSPVGWIGLIAMAVVIVTAILWGIFGNIATKVSAQGILIKSGGIHNIVHTFGGTVADIRVKRNDIVKKGEIVGRIDNYDLVEKINLLKDQLKELEGINTLSDKENITKLKKQIKTLQSEFELETNIISPYSGKVVEVNTEAHSILKAGDPFISVEITGETIKDLEAVVYISAEEGKKITPGMEVQISPSTVKKEEFGYMIARVISVSEFPATYQSMLNILGNEELAKKYASTSPVEVRAELVTDSNTISGYSWSTPHGPSLKINSGTICTASVTIKNDAPIKILIAIK